MQVVFYEGMRLLHRARREQVCDLILGRLYPTQTGPLRCDRAAPSAATNSSSMIPGDEYGRAGHIFTLVAELSL